MYTIHPISFAIKACALAVFFAFHFIGISTLSVSAQQSDPEVALEDPEPVIERTPQPDSDVEIDRRLSAIFSEFDGLRNVTTQTVDGVVLLTGDVANDADAAQAQALAIRVEGVVTVQDELERTLDVGDNIAPLVSQLEGDLDKLIKAMPLIGIAFLVFCIVFLVGHVIASMRWFWRLLTPNPFLADILAQAIRVLSFLFALFAALSIVGATALMAAILGGAGVAGLAIGFAVRDTLENYISSIMLSLRQPFRGGDHVVIGDQEGIVSRLTTRATILMTMDGNHLRIPNADVFKATILNYTTNPQRRFSFKLGVDAADDPVAAINSGKAAIEALDFVLSEPAPFAMIESVGDSSIILVFFAWVDQGETDFAKGRSLAIRATKDELEANDFTLPEPIYRIRLDSPAPQSFAANDAAPVSQSHMSKRPKTSLPSPDKDVSMDTKPEVDSVRAKADDPDAAGEQNLLDDQRPSE